MEKTNRVQLVRSKPERMLVGSYLSPKGVQMMAILARRASEDKSVTSKIVKYLKADIRAKYTKNRYAIDPESKIIKGITHPILIRGNVSSLKESAKTTEPVEAPVAQKKKKKGLLSSLLTALIGIIFLIFRR
jgi:hypothetical protein